MERFDVVYAISKELNGDLKAADKALSSLLKTITQELENGGAVKLVNFGEFEVVRRAPRKGHNPHTGEIYPIPACNEPVFRVGKQLKEMVNAQEEQAF